MKLFVVACLALVLCGASLGVETEEDTVLAPEAAFKDLDNTGEEDLEPASEADDDIETAIEAFVKASAQDGYEVFDEAHAIALLYGDPKPDENEVEIIGRCAACYSATHCVCYCKSFKLYWKQYQACAAVYVQSGYIGVRAKLNNLTLFCRKWPIRGVGSKIKKCYQRSLFGIRHNVCAGLSGIHLNQRSLSAIVYVRWWSITMHSKINMTW